MRKDLSRCHLCGDRTTSCACYLSGGSASQRQFYAPCFGHALPLPNLPRKHYTFLDSLGRITVLAPKRSEVDFRRLKMYHGSLKVVPAITYPFQRKEIPYYRGLSNKILFEVAYMLRGMDLWGRKDMNISASSHPSLIDHVICGEPVMPAAGYIEMVRSPSVGHP